MPTLSKKSWLPLSDGAAPLARLSSSQSRHRPLSSTRNSGPGPRPALTHILLERVDGEQRHLAGARALVAAIAQRLGSGSGLEDPRLRLPRRLARPRPRPGTSATSPARLPPDGPAPGPRSALNAPSGERSRRPRASSQRPCVHRPQGGGSSSGPKFQYGSGGRRGHLPMARTRSHGAGDLRGRKSSRLGLVEARGPEVARPAAAFLGGTVVRGSPPRAAGSDEQALQIGSFLSCGATRPWGRGCVRVTVPLPWKRKESREPESRRRVWLRPWRLPGGTLLRSLNSAGITTLEAAAKVTMSLCRFLSFRFPSWSRYKKTAGLNSVQSLSRVRLCYPMNCSTPGFPVHHQLPEFTQTHVHGVGDAIQSSLAL